MSSCPKPGVRRLGRGHRRDDGGVITPIHRRHSTHRAFGYSIDDKLTVPAEQLMPMIHLVFSNLKTWLNGIHQVVSAKHLQAYLKEFTFRFNKRFCPFNAFRSLLGIAGGVEAQTYADPLFRRVDAPYIKWVSALTG